MIDLQNRIVVILWIVYLVPSLTRRAPTLCGMPFSRLLGFSFSWHFPYFECIVTIVDAGIFKRTNFYFEKIVIIYQNPCASFEYNRIDIRALFYIILLDLLFGKYRISEISKV